jgi:hypothetical protein
MSKIYRLMMYFVVATLYFYEDSIESYREITVGEFEEKNKNVIKRVFQEGLNIMRYELSNNQMSQAIAAYLKSRYCKQSIRDTEPFISNKN